MELSGTLFQFCNLPINSFLIKIGFLFTFLIILGLNYKKSVKDWIFFSGFEQVMDMMYYPLGRSSCSDSLKVLEADIQHANSLWVFTFFFKWIFWSLIEVVGFINLFVLLAFRLFVYVFVCDCIVFWLWFVLVCFVIMWSWWCCSYNIMQLKLESLWWLWILYVFGGRNVRIGMTLVVFKCHLFLMGIGHSVDYGFFVNFRKILVLLFVVNAISWILMNLHVSVRCINKFFVWIVWRWLCCRDLLVVDIRHVSKLRWVVRLDRLGTL